MSAEPVGEELRLGPFRVVADEEHVARYRRETGFEETLEKIVPAAFPAVWMMTPGISAAIRAALDGENALPVHESQNFRYFAPLRVGESYDLTVSLRREASPPRLAVNASVTTPGGEARLHVETLLRIVPRPHGLEGAP